MRPFSYSRADTVQSAVHARMASDTPPNAATVHAPSQYLAGGTTLIDLMKLDVMRPQNVTDINALESTSAGEIEFGSHGLHLGALVRMSAAADHPDVRRELSDDRTITRTRGQPTDPQHGVAWRKCAAADALYLFPRHLLHGLQQTHAGFRLRCHGRH